MFPYVESNRSTGRQGCVRSADMDDRHCSGAGIVWYV